MKVVLFLLLATMAFAQTRKVTDEEVRKVTESAILLDSHNDVTSRTVDGFDIGERSTTGHTDLPRLKQGGVGGVFFAVYVDGKYDKTGNSANRALQMIDTVRHDIAGKYPKDFQLAYTADDIVAARRSGKIAAMMGIEGGHAIEDSPRLLRDFYLLGVRYMTLTHFNTNHWADSSGDIDDKAVEHHNGLTPLGKDIVREMNRLGMIVDISHTADKTFWDAIDTSKAPIFASHSSCRALCNVPRNMTDEMIVALGKKRGVIQINFNCGFLTTANPPHATLGDVVAHIDHVAKLAGVDSVGIGSDFDGVGCVPDGLEDVSKFPNLTRALLEKGYSADDIRKIYGGNTLRLMREVEKARN
jgi:membrane dipeptidase